MLTRDARLIIPEQVVYRQIPKHLLGREVVVPKLLAFEQKEKLAADHDWFLCRGLGLS
jgi:hypothetical protein